MKMSLEGGECEHESEINQVYMLLVYEMNAKGVVETKNGGVYRLGNLLSAKEGVRGLRHLISPSIVREKKSKSQCV